MIRTDSQYRTAKKYYIDLLLIHDSMKGDTKLPIHVMRMGSSTLWKAIRYLKDEIELWELQQNIQDEIQSTKTQD